MKLPPKSPFPIEPGHEGWLRRYFDVGDTITWRPLGTHNHLTDTVIKVKKNNYGRISYVTKYQKLVFTEEIVEPTKP